jgi:hypothetical protein
VNKKKKRKIRKSKVLFSAKPNVFSYLLCTAFPLLILLADDWIELFSKWDFTNDEWIFKLLTIFFFFGLPVLGLLSIKTTNFYINRVEFKYSVTGKVRVKLYENLIYWREYSVLHTVYTPSHEVIELKFRFKKYSISSLEVQEFKRFKQFMIKSFAGIQKK